MSEAQSLTELPAVARNINLPCKKCGVDRFFVVVAHTTPTSAKVKCEVCGAQKTFKLAKPETEKKKKAGTGVKRVTKSRGPSAAEIWEDLKTQIGTDKAVPYSMKSQFKLANAINHPKFGIGFVTNASHDRVDVAFSEGTRALVHNRP
ncbi:MAG: hypothetical protein EOP05_08670 [Proteobacteria bacterium]|nr:MAG: hypothetical protein EOP05_08670 [Pseudomonadota bacterium]